MKKVILNKCYGGFDVSKKAYELYARKKGLNLFCYEMDTKDFHNPMYKYATKENLFIQYFTKDFGNCIHISNEDYEKYNLYLREDHREDPILIEVVEELGKKASGRLGELEIVEIPDDLEYVIDNYDGMETLHQKVREW